MSHLLNTGFLYALLNKNDQHHEAVRKAALQISGPIFLPTVVTTEVANLIRRDLGGEALAQFLIILSSGRFPLMEPTENDYKRASKILKAYANSRISFVDAIVCAMAERLRITKILTIDRHHFVIFRPKHCLAFEILP